MKLHLPALAAALLISAPAQAGELFGGILAHEAVNTFSKSTGEGGADFQLGYRSAPISPLRFLGGPRAYAFGSVNSNGDTNFLAAGLSWKFGSKFYARPGLGIAVHDGPGYRCCIDGDRTDLGSRVLFEPELGLGVRLAPRITAEATWVHLSHARIFGGQNPGLDMVGLRLNLRLP